MADPTNFTNVGSPIPNTSVFVPGLTPGNQYDLDVIATNSSGSATSTIITATTGTTTGTSPAAVTALTTSIPTTSSISLSWAASASGTPPIAYQAQFRLSGQTVWTNSGPAVAGTSLTVSGLNSGSSYDFQIISSNASGSATSSIVTASTQVAGVAPSAPFGLISTNVQPQAATISWTRSIAGTAPISYQLQVRLTPTGTTSAPYTNISSSTTGNSVTAVGLTSGTSYDFIVVATNSVGTSTSSALTVITGIVPPPGAPGSVSISSVTSTTATLVWSSSSGTGPITYQPQYRLNGTSVWYSSRNSVSGLTATVSGLNPGGTYDFQIVAQNPGGSTASAVQTAATTVSPLAPSPPGLPVAWIITPTSVSLAWMSSQTGSAPISYQIQYRVTGTTSWIGSGSLTQATAGTASNLAPGTNYDFRIAASNASGVSFSVNFLTIFAPVTGGIVSSASYQPNQILSAEALDASLDSKLDVTGGTVGPLQQTQTDAGGGQPPMLSMSRSGGVNDSPMISGSYIALFSDGPVIQYSSIGMTITVSGDANGNGPAGNIWNIVGAININVLRSSSAPANGSQHAGLVGRVIKGLPPGGVPAGRRLADGWAVYAPATDSTGLPSTSGGALRALNAPVLANNRDDADLRYGANITYGEAAPVAVGGVPAEFSRGLFVGAGSATAYAKVIIELGGGFTSAGLDLRGASAQSAVVTSSSPSAPVTALSVDRALPFASAGSPVSAVSATNPKSVFINGNRYSVVAVGLNAGVSSGVLTFGNPVAAADAAQGQVITPDAHTLWLSEGGNGALPGDIALNKSATSRIFYDSAGGGPTLAAGSDRITLQTSRAVRLAVGNTGQRPPQPLLGDVRANSDNSTLEFWQPSASTWVSLASTTIAPGIIPGAATALVSGAPTTSAVSLSWTAPTIGSTPISFQLQYRVTGTTSWTDWGAPQAATSSTVSGLTSGTRYDFQVVTSNIAGSSTSAITSVTISAIAPSAPTGLTATSATSTTLLLTWTGSASGTTPISYTPNYRVTGTTPWFVSPSGATTGTSQTITGLTAATSYDFQIVASNSGGSTPSSTTTQSTSTAATVAPSAPTSVAAGSPTSSTLIVSWAAPGSGTAPFSYQVLFRVTGTTPFFAFGGSITATTLTVTGLTAATSYDFEVTALNSSGSSTSSAVTAVTAANPIASTGTVSGSQASGASVPVITGPATGAVVTSNVLGVTGVTVSDPAAATAAGACTLKMTCTTGTVSSTVGGAQVAGSGTKTITYVNTLAACQTAAADLIYTAGPTVGTDNVVVMLTDQAGNNHSISIAIAISAPVSGGGAGGTIPTDSTGEVAKSAQVLLNGFGVNTRIDDAGYQGMTLSTVENCINYLSGIKILRDAGASGSDSTWWPQVAQATGIKFIASIGITDASNFQTQLNNIKSVPVQFIAAFEGCDEADTGQAIGFAESLSQAAVFQQAVWAAGQTAGLPVIQLSTGQGFNVNPSQGNYGSFGNLAAFATYGCVHLFPAQSPQTGSVLSTFISLAGLGTPGKPAAITEFGYNQIATAGYGHCSPAAAAAYIIEYIFDSFNAGCPYYMWHELIDDAAVDPGTVRGLFTDAGAPRPSATAIQNLFTLLSDGNTNATTFTPGKLNYSLSNFPTLSGGNGGYHTLLQKSDGTFWLALWNEQPLNDPSTGADLTVSPITITLTLGTTPISITVYDPSVSATAVQSSGAVSSVSISLPARVILVKIVHA